MSDQPRAIIREINDQLVLDDPDALAMIRVVEKLNCKILVDANTERIEHFKRRVVELKLSPEDVVITLINVDDACGRVLADLLMPGMDWQPFRDRGEIPVARGLASRPGVAAFLEQIDQEAANKLHAWKGLAIVVVDRGVAEVFQA